MTPAPLVSDRSVPPLQQVVRRIQDVSTLPQVALRVLKVASDPDCGADQLKDVMEVDASLSARVLRCVNSSGYARRIKITNLQQAIAFLGSQQIRNLALTASVSKLFSDQEAIGCYTRKGLWQHLVAVGVGARMIALRLGIPEFEDAFLAGLLHDIGIIIEDEHVHDSFRQVVQSLTTEKTLQQVERECLGFDHTKLGEAIGRQWGFPEIALAAIVHHHDCSGTRYEGNKVVWCVALANLLCSLKGYVSVGLSLVQVPLSAIAGLALAKEDILAMVGDLERELETNQELFQI